MTKGVFLDEDDNRFIHIAGTFRKENGEWFVIDDDQHTPLNVSDVTFGTNLVIDHPAMSEIVGGSCDVDETFSRAGYSAGISIGSTQSVIKITKELGAGPVAVNASATELNIPSSNIWVDIWGLVTQLACFPAPSCLAALKEASRLWPNRSTVSDGICASAAHNRQNPRSDHATGNAWDITHDPANGCDAHQLARQIAARKDARIKYIISNRRIWYPTTRVWLPYLGINPHKSHAHFSIKPQARSATAVPWWSIEVDKESEEIQMDSEWAKDNVKLDANGETRLRTPVVWSKFVFAYRVPRASKPKKPKQELKQPQFAIHKKANRVELVVTEGPPSGVIDIRVRRTK